MASKVHEGKIKKSSYAFEHIMKKLSNRSKQAKRKRSHIGHKLKRRDAIEHVRHTEKTPVSEHASVTDENDDIGWKRQKGKTTTPSKSAEEPPAAPKIGFLTKELARMPIPRG